MNEICDWKQVAVDEWETGCITPSAMEIIAHSHWKHCPYCGKKINWVTKPQVET